MRSSGSPSAFRNFEVHAVPSASLMPSSSPLDRPSVNAKMRDRSMPITFGFRSSTTCTSICHCSSPHSSAWRPPTAFATAFAEVRASKTPPCEVPPSAMRSMHDGAGGVPAAAQRSKNT